MHDRRSHPLLAQVPLTVSPFVQLPSAITLPYTYKTLPSTLPPSAIATTATTASTPAQYVVSESGHAAHPDEIIASCKALKEHIQKLQDEADRELKQWEDALVARDLAEKRRVAPGWLDSDARILEPEKRNVTAASEANLMDEEVPTGQSQDVVASHTNSGDELDKAFGGLDVSKS